jgi:hypothetical protein
MKMQSGDILQRRMAEAAEAIDRAMDRPASNADISWMGVSRTLRFNQVDALMLEVEFGSLEEYVGELEKGLRGRFMRCLLAGLALGLGLSTADVEQVLDREGALRRAQEYGPAIVFAVRAAM